MNKNEPIRVQSNIIIRFAAFVIVIAGIIYAASLAASFLLALFISIICAQPILWLQKKKVPKAIAITIVFLGILAIFFGFGEIIANSFSSFAQDAPKYEENLHKIGQGLFSFSDRFGVKISTEEMSKLLDPSKVISITTGFLGQLGGFMGNAFTIFFLVLFLLLELDSIPVKSKAIIKDRRVSLNYLKSIGSNIRHYLSIKTFTSLLTGVLIWASLAIIGVDYAIIWGLIAFMLNYIPNIGSIIAAIPAVLFSLIQFGFGGVIWTSSIFVIVNMIIGSAVEPKLMGKGLGLSTFVVFLSLIFWGFVLGTVGMFLSVPLTMAIKIMVEQNPKTQWIAVILGTQEEAKRLADHEKD